jgi:hypothetical protein
MSDSSRGIQKDLQQLRSQLDKERQAAVAREAEAASMQARLTHYHEIVLNSSRELANGMSLPPRAALLMSQPLAGAHAGAYAGAAATAALQRPGLATSCPANVPSLWSLGSGCAPWRTPQSSVGSGVGAGPLSGVGPHTEGGPMHWGPQTCSAMGSVRLLLLL